MAGGASMGFGKNWQPTAGLAGLTFGNGIVTYQGGANAKKVFVESGGGNYEATYFVLDRLYLDPTSNQYRLTGPDGSVKFFNSTGQLVAFQNAGGNGGTVTYSSGKLATVNASDGTDSWQFDYTWDGNLVESVIFKVNGTDVRKADYAYDGNGNLFTIKTYAFIGGTWGTQTVEAVRYSYDANDLLRHVITPTGYRQMLNNGLNPETASDSDLNDYAETEYVCDATSKRVTTMYTHGRSYTFGFTYTPKGQFSTSLNVWTAKTVVALTAAGKSESSLITFYFNRAGAVILKRVGNDASSPTKTWNANSYQYQEGSCRTVVEADAAAIDLVNETLPELVMLHSGQGLLNVKGYDIQGRLSYSGVRKGTGGALHTRRQLTYSARAVTGFGTIYVPATEKIFRGDGNTNAVTTTFGYSWHSGTFQMSQRVTTLPAIPTGENGTGTAVVLTDNFDAWGFRSSSVDGRGTVTGYSYSRVLAAMTQKVLDQGSGKLNLTTDYTPDNLGRTTLELEPPRDIDLGGSSQPTNLRKARWTYYKDREGEVCTFEGYRTTSGSVDQIVGPVTVIQPNLAPPSGYTGYRQASHFDAVHSGTGIPSISTTFARSTWVRWKLTLFSKANEKIEEWTYFVIPLSFYGTQSTNYGKRVFAYDWVGRLNQTTCAGGTIDKTTFNAMGWPVQEELGTSGGLTVTRINDYDDSGNLTKVTLPVDSTSANDRVTDKAYDFRHRLIEDKTVVEKDGGGTWTLFTRYGHDNRDLLTSEIEYHTSVTDGNRMGYRTRAYDALGRRYRAERRAVSASGVLGNTLTDNWYYDPNGVLAREAPAGSALNQVIQVDAVGRPSALFLATGTFSTSDPSDISGATVIEQASIVWDHGGNRISVTTKARFHSGGGTGALNGPTTQPKARISYRAFYPDAIGRLQADVDYGTNGAATWTRLDTIPTRSDDRLITSNTYDGAGNQVVVTDPADRETCFSYDRADRLRIVVENCGSSSSSSSSSSGFATDVRTTRYDYTDDNWLKKLTSDNAATGDQITEWIYGVTPAQGSALYNNRLVREKKYPDSTGGSDVVSYTYNRQREVITLTDQAGTAHGYLRDKLSRLLSDTVSAFGTGIDTTVNKLEWAFDERGRRARAATYLTIGGGKRNEVQWEYNDFDQPIAEYQEHSGGVNTSTTLKVQYGYANGSGNTVRPTSVTYPTNSAAPTNTVITTDYGTGLPADLSRPHSIKQGSATLATFRFLGLGRLVNLKYDGASNAELTYENGGAGDAGDIYTGLDRFNRLVETIWKTSSADLVHTTYGRNRVGGVTWKRDDLAHAMSVATEDHFYWYDGLQQNVQHERGELTPSSPPYTGIASGTRQQQEIRSFDETGNWLTDYVSSIPLNQTREHNKANEITQLSSPGVLNPSYDAAGNMTSAPLHSSWNGLHTLKWDAWNRLIEIWADASELTINEYDAMARRVSKTVPSGTCDYFYNQEWRCLEERVSGDIAAQYTWNPLDRWTLIRRTRSVSGTLDETRYVLKDYLDPAAIITTAASVDERYSYDAFGPDRKLSASFGSSTSTADWNFLFHAEFMDQESGLYNYGFRFYHPSLGRWISREPIEDVGELNLYRFVFNWPIALVDLWGLDTYEDYVNKWKKKNQPDLSPNAIGWAVEKMKLGCVGLAASEIGTDPDYKNCWRTRAQAEAVQRKMEKDDPNCCPQLYSVHLWVDPGKDVKVDTVTGFVDMSTWDKSTKPGPNNPNFDVGVPIGDSILHANAAHNPKDPLTGKGANFPEYPITEMVVKVCSKKEWTEMADDPSDAYNLEVWCVQCKGHYGQPPGLEKKNAPVPAPPK